MKPKPIMQPTVNEQRSTTKRGPGRPKLGKGVDRVLISIEKGLLKQADAFAKSKQMTRSEMVSRGLRLIMGSEPGSNRKIFPI